MDGEQFSKGKLVYRWEKMGEETGALLGKMIGLGMATGLQSLHLMSKVLASNVYPKK